ncbi:MAG: hypothetical protein Q4P66_09045 [Actinomycetaceae bacterium]|nr:hypothetical protein [Actinomycetaceae bacterium]
MSVNLEQQARDPKTPLKQLQYIAQNHPHLRPSIALNPSTYPALLDWLSEFHDPAIDAALDERLHLEKQALASQADHTRPPRKQRQRQQPKDLCGSTQATPSTEDAEQQLVQQPSSATTNSQPLPIQEAPSSTPEQTQQALPQRKRRERRGVVLPNSEPEGIAEHNAHDYYDTVSSSKQDENKNEHRDYLPDEFEKYENNAEKPKKRSRFALWLVGLIVVIAVVAVAIALAVFTDSVPFIGDESQSSQKSTHNSKDSRKHKDPTKQDDSKVAAPKTNVDLNDASSGDANGDGVLDAHEQKEGGQVLQLDEQQRLIVPPPDDVSQKKPVPDGAVTNVTKFGNTDGNIQCAIGAGGVQCALNKPAATLDIGNNGKPIQVTLDQSLSVEVMALGGPVSKTGQVNLSSGAAVVQGQFVCQGTGGNGIDCWDTNSAHGFTLEPNSVVRY